MPGGGRQDVGGRVHGAYSDSDAEHARLQLGDVALERGLGEKLGDIRVGETDDGIHAQLDIGPVLLEAILVAFETTTQTSAGAESRLGRRCRVPGGPVRRSAPRRTG